MQDVLHNVYQVNGFDGIQLFNKLFNSYKKKHDITSEQAVALINKIPYGRFCTHKENEKGIQEADVSCYKALLNNMITEVDKAHHSQILINTSNKNFLKYALTNHIGASWTTSNKLAPVTGEYVDDIRTRLGFNNNEIKEKIKAEESNLNNSSRELDLTDKTVKFQCNIGNIKYFAIFPASVVIESDGKMQIKHHNLTAKIGDYEVPLSGHYNFPTDNIGGCGFEEN